MSVGCWDLAARVLCCCSRNVALKAALWGINPLCCANVALRAALWGINPQCWANVALKAALWGINPLCCANLALRAALWGINPLCCANVALEAALLGINPLCCANVALRAALWGINPLCCAVTDAVGAEGPALLPLLPRGELSLGFNRWFSSRQPALLYLVPACIGFPLLVALAKGEVTEMFR